MDVRYKPLYAREWTVNPRKTYRRSRLPKVGPLQRHDLKMNWWFWQLFKAFDRAVVYFPNDEQTVASFIRPLLWPDRSSWWWRPTQAHPDYPSSKWIKFENMPDVWSAW